MTQTSGYSTDAALEILTRRYPAAAAKDEIRDEIGKIKKALLELSAPGLTVREVPGGHQNLVQLYITKNVKGRTVEVRADIEFDLHEIKISTSGAEAKVVPLRLNLRTGQLESKDPISPHEPEVRDDGLGAVVRFAHQTLLDTQLSFFD